MKTTSLRCERIVVFFAVTVGLFFSQMEAFADRCGRATRQVYVSGNMDAAASVTGGIPETTQAGQIPSGLTTNFADLNSAAEYSLVFSVFDTLGDSHDLIFYMFKTSDYHWTFRGYAYSEDVDPIGSETERPRHIGSVDLTFRNDGLRNNLNRFFTPDIRASIPWNNGARRQSLNIFFRPFSQYAALSSILNVILR